MNVTSGHKVIALSLCLLLIVLSASASNPTVWFCPLDAAPRPQNNYPGSPQYMDLFSPDAAWKQAASHINVFKIYPNWIQSASDADLERQFADLRRRRIGLALEYGPLTTSTECAKGITGEGSGGQNLLGAVRRIGQDGGNLKYVAMDEPVFFSTMSGACHWEPEQTAANAAVNIRAVLAEFPDIEFGVIEPIGGAGDKGTSTQDMVARYQRFIRAFKKELGVSLAFFHVDVAWDSLSFPSNLVALREMIAKEDVQFGIIYNGTDNEQSNSSWINSAKRHMQQAEESAGTPDTAIFQSWAAFPSKLLPEADSDSFTSLVDQYIRPRTKLTLSVNGQNVSGRLTDLTGQGIASAEIKITVSPKTGSDKSVEQVYSFEGVIPPGSRKVGFGVRINTECGCSGKADFRIMEFSFQSDHIAPIRYGFGSVSDLLKWPASIALNRVHGLTTLAGGGQVDIVNNALRVVAQPGQEVLLNAIPITIRDSGEYRFDVKTVVSPESLGSGNLLLIFFGDAKEISRSVIPLRSIAVPIGTATTVADGYWKLTLPAEYRPGFSVRAMYSGDMRLWATSAEKEVN